MLSSPKEQRRIGPLVALLTVLICGVTVVAGLAQRPAPPKTHHITIHNFQFNPANLTIPVGDTVEWKNDDIVPHTVSDADGGFDSDLIQPGATWRFTAKKPGTYHYGCEPHPNMQAVLTVK